MALKLDTFFGQPRLLGDGTAEDVTLFPGQLAGLSLGVWLLGGDDTVIGSSDAEFIVGNQGGDFLIGLGEADSIFGGRDDDFLLGGEGNDLVRGDVGDDLVAGDEGNDVLRGGRGNDRLFGYFGNDTLYGDRGTDNLTGDRGNDVFVIGNKSADSIVTEVDTIEDFQKGEDLIALTEGLEFENLTFLPDSQNPSNTLIQKETGELLAILKDANSTLERSDFLIPGTLALSAKDFTVNADGTSNTVTVTRAGGSDGVVSAMVRLEATGNFSSIASNGFENTPVMVSFASGDTMPKTVQLPIINNALRHYDRRAALTLENPTGIATLGEPNTAEVIVVDVNLRSPSRILTPSPNLIEGFGTSIAASGNQLLIGTVDNSAPINGGIAYLFDISTGTLLKTFQRQTGFAPYLSAPFGKTVAIANNKVLIGSPSNNSTSDNLYTSSLFNGVVYLFNADTGALLQTFRSPNAPDNNTNDLGYSNQFGDSIAFVGNNVLIGDPSYRQGKPAESGFAYLFDSNSGQLLQTFRNPNPEIIGFGKVVAALGNNVAIGAPGNGSLRENNFGVVYSFDSLTGQLLQTFHDPNPRIDNQFGSKLVTTGNDVLIGAPMGDVVYRFNGSSGELIQTFSNPNLSQNPGVFDLFGSSLAIADNDILIGAPGYESRGAVFRFNGTTGNLVETYLNTLSFTQNAIPTFANFGASVTATGGKVAIGVPQYSNGTVLLF